MVASVLSQSGWVTIIMVIGVLAALFVIFFYIFDQIGTKPITLTKPTRGGPSQGRRGGAAPCARIAGKAGNYRNRRLARDN